jgi:hypothetical protein
MRGKRPRVQLGHDGIHQIKLWRSKATKFVLRVKRSVLWYQTTLEGSQSLGSYHKMDADDAFHHGWLPEAAGARSLTSPLRRERRSCDLFHPQVPPWTECTLRIIDFRILPTRHRY